MNGDLPDSFVADTRMGDAFRLYLSHTGIERSNLGALNWLGWELLVNRLTSDGEVRLTDWWEDTLLEALQQAASYSSGPIDWQIAESGQKVDLLGLQSVFDASRRYDVAIESVVSPDGSQRLCFNAYDDERYRFTLEELIRDGSHSAWLPTRWSKDHQDLAGAKEEARATFDWFV